MVPILVHQRRRLLRQIIRYQKIRANISIKFFFVKKNWPKLSVTQKKIYTVSIIDKMVKWILILFDQVSENEMTEFLENAPEFCREKIRQAAYTESSESKMKTKHISHMPAKKFIQSIQVSCNKCTVYQLHCCL